MLNQLIKTYRTKNSDLKFSILIPSWNNLQYLKCCISGIKKNSTFNHQIIVIINEGTDGTKSWVEQNDEIDFVYSPKNIGICYGLNSARSLIKADYILYMNDDMYVLPEWDAHLVSEINRIGHKNFMLSATMIEPTDTENNCVIVKDFGQTVESFKEDELLTEYKNLNKENWMGSTWPPNVLHIDMWDLVGGMSTEYHPGMYSDPDLSIKCRLAGVHQFMGVGKSLVYHFGSKSTRKLKNNIGRKIFIRKWGISAKQFTDDCLHRGEIFKPEIAPKKETFSKKLKNYFKNLLYAGQSTFKNLDNNS